MKKKQKQKSAKAEEQYANAPAVEITATYCGNNTYRNHIHKGDSYTIKYDGYKEKILSSPIITGESWVLRTYRCKVCINGKQVFRLEHSWVPEPISKEARSPENMTKWMNDFFSHDSCQHLVKVVAVRTQKALA